MPTTSTTPTTPTTPELTAAATTVPFFARKVGRVELNIRSGVRAGAQEAANKR